MSQTTSLHAQVLCYLCDYHYCDGDLLIIVELLMWRAQEWEKIWALNKKVIDPVCPRHTAVATAGRVRLRLNNGPAQPEVVTLPRHKKHPPAGVKATTYTKAGLLALPVCRHP